MDLPKEFLEEAYDTRRDIMGLNNDILPESPSKYNSEVYIHICEVCGGKGNDIHHIEFQCLANKNNLIGNIHKNSKFNLVSLCKKCHDTVHHGNLEINGYKLTSNGIELDYRYIDINKKNTHKKKCSPEDINIIKQLKNIPNLSQKMACYKLKTEYDIQISVSTLGKIWRGEY